MAENTNDPFAQAKALYRQTLAPDSTLKIRNFLKTFVANPGGHPAGDVTAGWSLLANILVCDYLNRWNNADQPELDAATAAVGRALQLDPNHAFAHYAMGFIHRANGDHGAAQTEFKQSFDLDGSARARAQYANEFIYLGQPEEAVREIDAAIAASAGHPALGMFYWIKGRALFFMGQYEEAIPCLQQSMRSWQTLWYSRLYLASAYALTGQQQQAKDQLKEFDGQFPGHTTLAQIAQLERTSPSESPFALAGRRNFRQGLRLAGRS